MSDTHEWIQVNIYIEKCSEPWLQSAWGIIQHSYWVTLLMPKIWLAFQENKGLHQLESPSDKLLQCYFRWMATSNYPQ